MPSLLEICLLEKKIFLFSQCIPYILTNKYVAPISTSEVNLGNIIDVTSTSQLQFLQDHIMDRFPFLMLLRHVFVVNISRISISLRNVQNKVECIQVKR